MSIFQTPQLVNGDDALDRLSKSIWQIEAGLMNAPVADVFVGLPDEFLPSAIADLQEYRVALASVVSDALSQVESIDAAPEYLDARSLLSEVAERVAQLTKLATSLEPMLKLSATDVGRQGAKNLCVYFGQLRDRLIERLAQAARRVEAYRASWLANGAVVRPQGVAEWVTVTNAAIAIGKDKARIGALVGTGELKDNLKSGHDRRIYAASIVAYLIKNPHSRDFEKDLKVEAELRAKKESGR